MQNDWKLEFICEICISNHFFFTIPSYLVLQHILISTRKLTLSGLFTNPFLSK